MTRTTILIRTAASAAFGAIVLVNAGASARTCFGDVGPDAYRIDAVRSAPPVVDPGAGRPCVPAEYDGPISESCSYRALTPDDRFDPLSPF